MKSRFYLALGLLILVAITASNVMSQEDIDTDVGVLPNGNLMPDYVSQFPEQGKAIVWIFTPASRYNSNCHAVVFSYVSALASPGGLSEYADSRVRDYANSTYPCDIQRLTVTARLWTNSVLRSTSIANRYNSADALATASSSIDSCSTSNKLGRGDHEFQQGASVYAYTTEDTSC